MASPASIPPGLTRERESGVVLVLALLIMLVLAVVVTQLFYSSQIELRLANNAVLELQMEQLAKAALLKSRTLLVMDAEDTLGTTGEGEGGDEGTDGGGTMDGGEEEEEGSNDSLAEEWATGRFTMSLGQDSELSVKILIEDEDRKFNVLLLAATDEEYRLEWRERFVRLLDIFRDGEKGDLSRGDAETLLTSMEEWMAGERRDSELTIPPLATGDWRDVAEVPVYAPLSLAEFILGGGIDEPLFHGFLVGEQEDSRWIPGLANILTPWSNLVFVEPEDAEGGEQGDEGDDGGGTGADDEPEEEAPGVNNGRINVNTASLASLRALLPDDQIPTTAWEQFDEFRRDRLEELREEEESGFFDEVADPPAEDEPIYPLESVDDLRRFDGFSETRGSIETETWEELRKLLTVQSNVFTVTVVVGTHEKPRRFYLVRAVLWRRMGEDGAEIVPVIPFERVSPLSVDLTEFLEELEEFSDDYDY